MNYMDGEHDPGGKVRRARTDIATVPAVFSVCGRYRYRLERQWDTGAGRVLFVMMNPSTADDTTDDPTVAKCQKYARRWGFAGLLVGNVCAFRATHPKMLLEAQDPVGLANHRALLDMARESSRVVMAHGILPSQPLRAQATHVALSLRERGFPLYVLKLTAAGIPAHPLYLPDALQPTLWNPLAS
ncbi:Protein of unknown function DUF1643 [uncultured Caudovirales phage]|uniref:DUF1643 domain-containing protein n=1 Tax=uncultured Caudovirales phage TaxID=2100421 RepID=A0A6J5LY06_9CAUD|nr:Protein of unknown function DUF1643 [uncultured Caudovirales phage]